jgi:polyisoprenyl-phosphate glycosyltransferase
VDKISVIIPCHNHAHTLRRVYTDVLRELKKLPVSYEILFIDNASRDGSASILRLLSQQDYACHYVSLNHRVTPVAAIFLGAQLSDGDLLMLTDTRHPAYLIPELYQSLYGRAQCCGGDLITGNRHMRRQPFFKLLRREYVSEALQTGDISAFRKILLQDDTGTVWLPYTELERSLITWQDRLYSLMITYGNRVLTYIGLTVFLLLSGVPCFLIFMTFLDLPYAAMLYISVLLSLLFLITRLRHHPYFFRHEQLLLSDIRESTLPNHPLQKPDISKL